MTEPAVDLGSQTSKNRQMPSRLLDASLGSTPSHHGLLGYIGTFLSRESGTAAAQPIVSYSIPGETWHITMITEERPYVLITKAVEAQQGPLYLTDRDLDDARIKGEVSKLHAEMIACFVGVNTGEIEDGMTSDLGDKIIRLVKVHKDLATHLLAAIIHSKQVPPDALSHALRWIGRMKDDKTFHERLWLLRNCLKSSSPIIRDGAALGLAALGSPQAIPSLRQAIKNEKLPSLRLDLVQVLNRLEPKC